MSPPIWFLILAWLLISLPYYIPNSHLQELRWNLIKIIEIMPKSQNRPNNDNMLNSSIEAGRIRESQCWGRQRCSMACWSSSRVLRLVLLAGEILDFRRHFDTPFLMEILAPSCRSHLMVLNCSLCKSSVLDEVLQTSLVVLQWVLAQGQLPNPSCCAIFSSFIFFPFFCNFDDFENLMKTLKSKSKLAYLAKKTSSLKLKSKPGEEEPPRAQKRLLLAVWRRLASMVFVRGWGARLLMKDFKFCILLISKICSCGSQGLQLQFLRQHELAQDSANTTPC